MNLSAQAEVEHLQVALNRYAEFTRKSPGEIIPKKGGDLSYALAARLKAIAPAKGSIRTAQLAALKAGRGVKVRSRVERAVAAKFGAHTAIGSDQVRFFAGKKRVKSVTEVTRKGKRLNLRALMVQRELSVRESGSKFLSISARYPRRLNASQVARSRFGPAISEAKIIGRNNETAAVFTWEGSQGELPASAVHGLNKPKGQAAIALALRDSREDIIGWINDKNQENARKANLR